MDERGGPLSGRKVHVEEVYVAEVGTFADGLVCGVEESIELRVDLEERELNGDHDGERCGGGDPPGARDAFGNEKKIHNEDSDNNNAGAIEPDRDLLSEKASFAH